VKRWTRRELVKHTSLAAMAGLFPGSRLWSLQPGMNACGRRSQTAHVSRALDATKLQPFADRLRLPELIRPEGIGSSSVHNAVDAPYFKIRMRQICDKLHRDLPPSRLWSYGQTSAPALLEAKSHQGVLIDWQNELPPKHFLSIESPLHAQPLAPETRSVVHLHGARVPADSDGYPENWFGPGKNKLCFYPNQQDATALWFHDHAMGVNRLNIFAGLMGWYLLRDEAEDNLGLPSGKYELPLLIYDRSFTPDGQLHYPNPPDEGAWAEEFLGDAMVVNGKVQPYHEVEARKYRLRIANTANSRFFSLAFSSGEAFEVIGSDQGLLPAPVAMNRLVLAPAERTDIIVDFSQARGENVTLISDSLALMQFRIGRETVADASRVPRNLRPLQRIHESAAIRMRMMTLNEFDSDYGEPMVMLLNRKHWADPITEIMQLGTTEIWTLVNLTEDTHPIHLHMVRFQILDRQTFSRFDYLSEETLRFTGAKIVPSPHEMGWKDVVQCPGGMVTRIIIPFHGYSGKYLWHCHILEHEANDMMRPYEITV
jgi:spore coat protein A